MVSIRQLVPFVFAAFTITAAQRAATAAVAENPLPDCYYADEIPQPNLLDGAVQAESLMCFDKIAEACEPFVTLPTEGQCGGRNWIMRSPTTGHEDDLPNAKCAEVCSTCIKTGIAKGYARAQCDVVIEDVYGTVCQFLYEQTA